ncbi:hypothetical protein KAH43_08515 [Candidatus Bipolaricaulota bacterium]|nr:hypothetical protein [Candidatus Bipolaricaulota bacterium]
MQTDGTAIFAVVGHVYNFAAFPKQFEQWFSFLESLDPTGEYRGIVASGVLDAWGASCQAWCLTGPRAPT